MGFSFNYGFLVLVIVGEVIFVGSRFADAFGTYGFDIHHRYSDPVKGILDIDDHDLPEMGTAGYYSAMAHRDRVFRGRRLAGDAGVDSLLAFADGNDTYQLPSLGFLHYANVSVGSPSLWFLVALDTGSDLFWLPCDCSSCVQGLVTRTGRRLDFNIYSPNTSSTSQRVPCDSSSCRLRRQCSASPDICPYQVNYLSSNTSTTGILIEDTLHLTTENGSSRPVDAQIKLGCGMIQTGSFLDGAAPNGLFGLGMENISVPSTLASNGVTANSFSMCFGSNGTGRINFGDKGSSDQGETPFNLDTPHRTYNISVTQITVGNNVSDVGFTAIFDSGTSFTYLNDPAYTIITESFDSQAEEPRRQISSVPFDYCYNFSPSQETIGAPSLNLTMRGGDQFFVTFPVIITPVDEGGYVYCLALVKSNDVNIIGQNFMTGYRIVFDREKNVLGWKASDCYDAVESNTLPINPQRPSTSAPPIASVGPEATSRNGSPNSNPAQPQSQAPGLKAFSYTHFILVLSLITNFFIIISS